MKKFPDELAHYGVRGMEWGKRKREEDEVGIDARVAGPARNYLNKYESYRRKKALYFTGKASRKEMEAAKEDAKNAALAYRREYANAAASARRNQQQNIPDFTSRENTPSQAQNRLVSSVAAAKKNAPSQTQNKLSSSVASANKTQNKLSSSVASASKTASSQTQNKLNSSTTSATKTQNKLSSSVVSATKTASSQTQNRLSSGSAGATSARLNSLIRGSGVKEAKKVWTNLEYQPEYKPEYKPDGDPKLKETIKNAQNKKRRSKKTKTSKPVGTAKVTRQMASTMFDAYMKRYKA